MNHLASVVPNHEYGCSAQYCCLCFLEFSFLIISAICKETRSHMEPLALHENLRLVRHQDRYDRSYDRSYEPQLPVSKTFLVVWSGSHTSRLAQLISVILVVRVIEATDVLKIVCSVLRSHGLKPERIFGVSDSSLVSGFYSCPFLCADFLNRFVQYFVASPVAPTSSSDPLHQVSAGTRSFALFSGQN